MEKQNRKPGGALYACAALLVLAVLTVTVVTLVSSISRRARGEDAPPAVSDSAGESTAPVKTPATKAPSVTDERKPETTVPAPVTETPVILPDTEPAGEALSPSGEEGDAVRADEPLIFMQPVAGHVVKFHDTDMPVYSLTMNDWRTHSGIDVSAAAGSEVFACADGRIESIYSDPLMGECICIDHGDGLKSYYKNLSGSYPFNISEGVEVKAGACIGGVGDSSLTELADVTHLHFEMKLGGIEVDPLSYLPYEVTTQE